MNKLLLQSYYLLPPAARSLAASVHGLRLRTWRYGKETEALVKDALDRESWSASEWRTWREERLDRVLERAATKIPYYRDLWLARRRSGDRSSWHYLQNWPTLEKEAVRENPHAFVADDCTISRMFREHTSGTSGKPLDLWWSRRTVREWYALFEARWRRWHGVSRHDRWAVLGGQLVTPIGQRHPPFWIWNQALNQLYMSSYHLAPDLIPHYLDAIRDHQTVYLWGYTSALYELAREALRTGRTDIKVRVAITNAEPVFDYQRQAIADAFQCPVRETYGMAEIVAAAGECQEGRLHQWPEVGIVDVAADDRSVSDPNSGDLVCTGLFNIDMPLIRYRVGDRASLPKESHCACGRTLPLMDSIEGRVDDILVTVDGRRIGRLDPVFKADLPISEAQIIQDARDRIRIRYVPTAGCNGETRESLAERLRARVGSVTIVFEEVEQIPRTANGKFRAVVNKVPPEDLQRISGTVNSSR